MNRAVGDARERVVAAARLVREGRIFPLARARFRGMPLPELMPDFEVLTYRTPHGIRLERGRSGGGQDPDVAFTIELLIATTHSGAHVDAPCHVVSGDRWRGGSVAGELGDFGPTGGDASELAPLFARGILLDVAGDRGVEQLSAHEPVTGEELAAFASRRGLVPREGDVVLVRTGYGRHVPNRERMGAYFGAGPDSSAAEWLAGRGIAAAGSDTEAFEVQPPTGAAHDHPVHRLLLLDRGIPIIEGLDLEQLAAAGMGEFLFVALPIKIRGATGSMIDPIAVV